MKLLSNLWFIALIALVAAVGTMTFLVMGKINEPSVETDTVESVEIDGHAVAALWNTRVSEVEKLTTELQDKKRELEQKELELKKTSERILNEKNELTKLQEQIVAMQSQIKESVLQIENAETKNLRSQATVYSAMDAESTVKVFDAMDDVEVVKILYFMEPDIQAEIFTSMIESGGSEATFDANGEPKLTGPERVHKLNELLKFTQPPQK